MPENISCDLCGSWESRILQDKVEELKLPSPFKVVQCTRCGLVYQNPRMTEKEYEAYYNSNYFSSQNYLKVVEQKGKEYINKYNLIERHLKSKGKLLDIGCGTGHFLKIGKDRGWEVYGIELSKWAADYGRRNFNLDIRNIDIRNINLEEVAGTWGVGFDVVTLNHVLEHLPSPSGAIKMISEILHEEGLILIEVPNELDQLMAFLIARVRKWLYNRLYNFYIYKGPLIHHTFFFTKDSLIKILERSQFQILYIRTLNEDMFVQRNIFGVGGQLVRKILYKVGALIGRGPIIEVLARKRK